MADKHDPNLWESVGIAITGIFAGAGTMFAAKKRNRSLASDRVRTDIRKLQDTTLTMSKDIQSMQEAHKAQQATMERMEHEHDVVIAELFREIKNIGLSLREVAVEVRFALQNNNKGEGH